jgi:hypothetical protein
MITRARRLVLFVTALLIVAAWPPQEGRSLMMKAVNRAVDPAGTLPVLPPQLGFGMGDDVQAVEERDEQVRRFDEAYDEGPLTRMRLRLKVAVDPFEKTTTRQLLLVGGLVVAFVTLGIRRG